MKSLVINKNDLNKIVYVIKCFNEDVAFLEGYIYRIKTTRNKDEIELAENEVIQSIKELIYNVSQFKKMLEILKKQY